MSAPTATESLIEVLNAYHELNSPSVGELSEPPTPLEFSRCLHLNLPVVFRGAVSHWKAVTDWNSTYLRDKMGTREITVAETPLGNADAVVLSEDDGRRYFVRPHERKMPFGEFLDGLQSSEVVRYAQSQDDNLHSEFLPLSGDVAAEVLWAATTLGSNSDATNIWIGNERSVSALHKDNYENMFCQITGRKRFVLVSPYEAICVQETTLPAATYAPHPHTRELRIVPEEPARDVCCWPTVDPDLPPESKWWPHCRPLEVVLEPGDVLYLPALWYHKVSQQASDDGLCCAVNYWYDMDFSGAFYTGVSFARHLSRLAIREDEADAAAAVVNGIH